MISKLSGILLVGSISLHSFAFDEFLIEGIDENSTSFITPAKMASSYHDSPNSVTSIDKELIESLGIDSISDALRLVPGMIVAESHGSNSTIGYHGLSVHVPRQTGVLFNSNRVVRPGYAEMIWERLPVGWADLSSMEVIRGSSVADWGGSSFSSTVNMIHRPIALMPTLNFKTTQGSSGHTKFVGAGSFGTGAAKHGLSLTRSEHNGFDTAPQLGDFQDSYKGTNAYYNGEFLFDSGLLLDWYISASNYQYNFPAIDNVASNSVDVQATVGGFSGIGPSEENTVSSGLKYSSASSQGDINTSWHVGLNYSHFSRYQDLEFCFPSFFYDPTLEQLDAFDNIRLSFDDVELLLGSSAMFGVGMLDKSLSGPLTQEQQLLLSEFGQRVQQVGIPAITKDVCSSTDQDLFERNYAITAQWKRESQKISVVSSVYLKRDDANSLTYLGGHHLRNSIEWSNNLRYRATERLVLNLGVLADYNNDIEKTFFSPRASINYSFNKENIARFLVLKSHRLPGIHESERSWQYQSKFNLGELDHLGRTEGRTLRISESEDLKPEQITSAELGYTYIAKDNKFLFDAKVFKEQYSSLIIEPFSYIAFSLSNSGTAEIKGFETEISYRSHGAISYRAGLVYTYLDNSSNNLSSRSLYSRNFGSAYLVVPYKRFTVGLALYSSQNQAENAYNRFDLNLKRDFHAGENLISLALNYRRYPDQLANYSEYSTSDPIIFGFTSRDQFKMTFGVEF